MTRGALYTATARNSCNNKLTLPQPTRRQCTLVAYLSVPFHITWISVSEENPRGGLTVFLDFFLTKYFRKTDTRGCQISYNKGSFCPNSILTYPIPYSGTNHPAF